jgi:hypothetical protein
MRKATILSLLLVLVMGAGALAADVKVGGEVRYYLNFPKDEAGAPPWSDNAQYRVKVSATLNEQTSALIYLKSGKADGVFDSVLSAELTTKVTGLGTLAAGNAPDYGSSPFVKYGTVWGATGDETYGVSFASEPFGGFAGQLLVAPDAKDTFFGGELTYALPGLEGSSVGLSFNKKGNTDANLALIAKMPLTQELSLYGELGKKGGSDELNVQTLGAKFVAGPATLYGEGDLKAKKYYLQGTLPFQSVSLNAGYQFGDGYTAPGDDGKLSLWAKVSF